MKFRDPTSPHHAVTLDEALRIARERHGRPLRCQERVARETEPSRDLRELDNASNPQPVIVLADERRKA